MVSGWFVTMVPQWVWGGVKNKSQLPDKYHTLQLPRDSLARVAKKYDVKIGQLLEWNNIKVRPHARS